MIILKHLKKIGGFCCGLLNGMFGSGGGLVAVPLLEKQGIEAKSAHATSVAIIFVLSFLSTIIYSMNGNIDFTSAMSYIPFGIIGAVAGATLLKKIPSSLLRRGFAVIMIISAIRILLR